MRVLSVVHGFPPHAQGGSEVYAELQTRTLVEHHGDEVLVLTREHDPAQNEHRVRTEQRDGRRIAWVNNTFRTTRTFAETYDNPNITRIAARLIEEFSPDVAHVHHLTCLSTGILQVLANRKVPCIYTLHDYWLLCHRGQLLDRELCVCAGPEPSGCDRCLDAAMGAGRTGFAISATLRTLAHTLPSLPMSTLRQVGLRVAELGYRRSSNEHSHRRLAHMRHVASQVTHFLAPSEAMRQRFVDFGIARPRITHSPYGFDHQPFHGLTRTTSTRLRIGFLGSLMVSKAPHVLLEAFQHLPPGATAVDCFGALTAYHGDDSYRKRLGPLLSQPGVRLHGPVPHDRVPDVLASLDLLVVPSVWPENSPLVIHEAFLAGVPVVASRIGGIPETVVDGVNGLLFAPGDSTDLTRVLRRVLSESDLLSTLRRGIPAVRTIEDDVACTRGLYEACRRTSPRESRHVTTNRPIGSPAASARLAAIVLSYGAPDDTVLTVRSLLASRRQVDHVIVVDNDHADGCRRRLTPVMDRIAYLKPGHNLGFSGGMNIGIREALSRGASHVLLVNSDVIVPPSCIAGLEAALDQTPDAGIVGPVVMSRSDPDLVASLGMSYSLLSGRMRHIGHGRRLAPPTAAGPVDAVSGCLMLIRREVFETAGFLDEDYFFSFEDLEFCLRAKRAGFFTLLAARSIAYHEGGRSIGAKSPQRLYYAARNHLLVARHADPTGGWMRSSVRTVWIVILNVASAFRFRGGALPSRLAAVARGVRDYVGGRLGAASLDDGASVSRT